MGSQFQKPLIGTQVNWGHPLSRGLVGCWLMNEGAGDRVYDLSLNGNDGEVQFDAHWESGSVGAILDFDGNSDYIAVPHNDLLKGGASGMENFSIGFILRYASQAVSTLLDCRLANLQGLLIFSGTAVGTSHTVQFDLNDGVSHDYRNSYGPSLNDNLFHFLLFVFDRPRNLFTYYLDGIQVATQDISLTSGSINATSEYRIMGHQDIPVNATGKGQVLSWWHYNRTLTPQEISELYLNPYGMFKHLPIWMMRQLGWAHKFCGISSPGKVDGIASENIGKVMGVTI